MATQEERRARSEEICRNEGIPVNTSLPVVESGEDTKLRDVETAAWRAMCLCLVAMKGEGMPLDQVIEIVDEYDLESHLSPNEGSFVFDSNPTQSSLDSFSWRYEGFWTLLWALGWVNEFGRPDKPCDVDRAVRILWECKTSHRFIEGSKLRSLSTILDELDLIYRYDWACVEAKLNDLPIPGNLEMGIVYERHYALNWLVHYLDQEWDEITCDT